MAFARFAAILTGMLTVLLTGCLSEQPPSATPPLSATPPPSTAVAVPASAVPATPSPLASPTTQPVPTTGQPIPATGQPVPANQSHPPAASFPEPPDRDLYRLARELLPTSLPEDRAVSRGPTVYQPGRKDAFWLVDVLRLEKYQSTFELQLITAHAYWYTEEGRQVDHEALKEAAAVFEDNIYPNVTGAFGTEWTPGIDNDPHLFIMNARLPGVGGYFSSSDEYPRSVRPWSNEHEAIYINVDAIPVHSQTYLDVLAHEFQHAVHWNADPSEDSWVNEGLSELAVTITGSRPSNIGWFLSQSRPISLVHWPLSPVASGVSYGSAALFMHYLTQHYGGRRDITPLIREQADGIIGVEAFLRKGGYGVGFRDVFRDWAVANLLDEDEGPFGYAGLAATVSPSRSLSAGDGLESSIPQYATEYVRLARPESPATLTFRGETETALLPVDVGSDGCWWGNSGDSIDSTLSLRLDLRGAVAPSLEYQVWHRVEEGWDYGYLEVSADGANTWSIIETANTSSHDPVGNAFGPGYTGDSAGWVDESVSLDRFAGQDVSVRFQYVTDDAVNSHGICLRGLQVRGAETARGAQDWVPNGFVFVDNRVRQDYAVQLVLEADETQVLDMELDGTNSGQLTVERPEENQRIVAIVQAIAPRTRQPASYTLSWFPAN